MEESSPIERAFHDFPPSIQKAQTWIRYGWIAALVSAFTRLLFVLAHATGMKGFWSLWYFWGLDADIEQVHKEKKPFILR